ncbi:hypothetical protein N8143_04550 [Pelagibacteraceae bacterium]|nr:hypothetical protein [Pelagibacteraceae bacterium]
MKKLLGIVVLGLLLSVKTYADTIYNGTFIDAHSQVGNLISNETVSKIINKNDVDLTLLSMRGKWKTATQRYKSIQGLTQNKTRYLIPTKLRGFTRKNRPADRAIKGIKDLKKQAIKNHINYLGFGEIIVQHAPHNHKKLKYEGINNDLNSKKIVRAIDIVLKDNKPVILHIELNDYEEDSKKILSQLVKLSKKYPNDNFLLMHMAQIEFSEAEFIISKTNNIHFITSHADNEREEQMKRKPGRGQMGWINLFDKNNNFQKKWLDLMNKNPKRFVLALDNVWDRHWLRGYDNRIYMWRKALASLNTDSALLIACENANTYFKIGIKCLKERK